VRAFRDATSPFSLPATAGSLPRCLLVLFVSLLAATGAFAVPARQKTDAVHKQKLSATQPKGTIKVVVRDVVVDVVVTGHDGRPVTGLKKQDFKILDDGKLQSIRSFIVHQSPAGSRHALPKLPKLPSGVFTNYSAIPADAPLNVILLDLGNTPLTKVPRVRRQIIEFLSKQPLGARYAVFVMGDGELRMVQGFTADKDLLIAAIRSKRMFSLFYEAKVEPFKIHPTLGLTPGAGSDLNIRMQVATMKGRLADEGDGLGTASADNHLLMAEGLLGMLPAPTGLTAGRRDFWIHTQVGNTVNELADMSLLLSALPGRKNLFWFTGSLPISLNNLLQISRENERGSIMAASDLVYINNSSKIVRAAELLERSRTALYAIDARGLQVGTADTRWGERLSAEHSTLDILADITGGHAFYNTNGFKEAMVKAANDGENYYTLTYMPANVQFRGELRHIRVELRGRNKHTHLAYRRSYFANASDAAPEPPPPPLAFTLQHGAPTAQQILFWATVVPSGKPYAEKAKVATANARKGKRGRAHPWMLQTYVIHYILVAGMVKMDKTSRGKRGTTLQFAVRAYDREGRALRTILNSARLSLTPENYQRIEKTGLQMPLTIAVPVKTAFLRLAVRDDLSNHVGSLELSLPLKSAAGTSGK
jgi:VWFA-related protein